MLDRSKLKDFVESQLVNTDCFLTDLRVSPDNRVVVELDSDTGVDLDFCISLNHKIEEEFPSDVEDYELEVGSAGITSPLKLPRQYQKFVGKELEVFASDNRKYVGELLNADNDHIVLKIEQKVKRDGEKRPVLEQLERSFPYTEIRKAQYLLKF
ncbi:MAG: ribosome assembly cofactor RimP [Clostridium sp.]|nr:ribosome assembly cofactor RimP [Prevotella sp.]MCM1429734.1 ribosome assembly cofactor RimP [Clostridium sp.]MCM1476207.1 ribosome assembly cofactor RimP [Muribaculaceae bacterium]